MRYFFNMTKMHRLAGSLSLLLLACSCTSLPFAGSKGVILKSPDTPACPILVRTNAPPDEKQAAQKLADYLGRMGGQPFLVSPATNPLPDRAILVGIPDPDPANEERYAVRRTNGLIHIEGASLQGLNYGVYAFLEQVMGCRWWSWSEEDVPAAPTLKAGFHDFTGSPAMPFHSILSVEAMRPVNDFPLKRRTVSLEKFDGSHTLCPYLKPASDKNPELLPMNKAGKRAFNNLHMCYTAPGMAEALADAMDVRIKATGTDVTHTIYMAGMGDWYGGMCECERCKAIYAEEAWTNADGVVKSGYMGTLLRMINQTAEILESRHPGIRIGTAAYMSLEAPPSKTVPRHNVHIWMPHLRHCIVHAVDECDKNRTFYLNLRRWLEIAPGRVSIWDYGVNFNNFMSAFPTLRSIARNIQLYHQWGCHGVMVQGNYVSNGGDLVVLKNDVWGRLLWDPSLDTDRLIESFCLGYYGPAGRDLLAYVNTLEASVRLPVPVHLDEFEPNLTNKHLSPALIAQLDAILTRAGDHVKGIDPYERRVREARVGLDSAILCTDGPLVEKGDRLIRADLGDTWDRAWNLLRDCREASPREWGTGRSYRMGFITQHGGPLITLTQGALAVKVAPALNGRIRQISLNGRDLLHLPDFAKKESPNNSGSSETLNPHAAYFTPTGAVSATTCSMQAELGVGHWSPNTKDIAVKTVELTRGCSIRISGSVRRVARDESDKLDAAVVTEYAVTNAAGCIVETMISEDVWQKVRIPTGKPDPKTTPPNLGASSILRILLPDQKVTVLDTYTTPAVTGGRVWHDSSRGVLVVDISLAQTPVPPEGDAVYMLRDIELQPHP
jgi:hypothetical protein